MSSPSRVPKDGSSYAPPESGFLIDYLKQFPDEATSLQALQGRVTYWYSEMNRNGCAPHHATWLYQYTNLEDTFETYVKGIEQYLNDPDQSEWQFGNEFGKKLAEQAFEELDTLIEPWKTEPKPLFPTWKLSRRWSHLKMRVLSWASKTSAQETSSARLDPDVSAEQSAVETQNAESQEAAIEGEVTDLYQATVIDVHDLLSGKLSGTDIDYLFPFKQGKHSSNALEDLLNRFMTQKIKGQDKATRDLEHRMKEECRSALHIAEKKQLSAS